MSLLYKAQTRFIFHAHIKIKISVFYEDALFDKLFDVLESIDKKYNSYQPDSFIDRINKQAGHFVDVDDETVCLLQTVLSFADELDGEFDPTIMPLIRLWGFYKENQREEPPVKEEIERIKRLVNYRKIKIRDRQVKIEEGQEIITGSFIKAYAVDCLVKYMQGLGIQDAVINAGGSTIRAINNEGHSFWEVEVKGPTDALPLFRLRVGNQCYSTSALSKTFVEFSGKKYGHILSPKSGIPSSNRMVGVLSDQCLLGDVLTTGLFNRTTTNFLEKMALFSSRYGVEGFMIDECGHSVFTPGFTRYIIEKR